MDTRVLLLVTGFVFAAHAACSAGDKTSFRDDDGNNSSKGGGLKFDAGLGGSSGGGGNGGGVEPHVPCDDNLAIDSMDPLDGARAMGLCPLAQNGKWGVISAKYSKADGTPNTEPLGHGILANFGPNVNPQEGQKMLALSSGAARDVDDPGYLDPAGHDKMYTSGTPAGYPKESPACPGVVTGEAHDSVGLEIKLKTPELAKSFSFNFNFYTWEYPDWICSQFNDFMVAMLSPKLPSYPDGNISFDKDGNTISVNAGFLDVCSCPNGQTPPCTVGGKVFECSQGNAQLMGTGFGADSGGFQDHAATGWLETVAPLENPGGEITLFFAIWDSGDGVLDSTVLIDNLIFDNAEKPGGTQHVPDPK